MGTTMIGKDNIALEKKKPSALTKAVKRVKKNPEGKAAREEGRNVDKYRRGIIMLKHVPHGFYEKEMRGYFSQFGRVLRIRVARSEKTGKSRGYAFVEFEFEEVAKIAAEAMNNYLMFERLIKCELLPPQVKSRNIFQERHIREDNYPKLKSREHATQEQNRIMTQEQVEDVMGQRQKKIQQQNKRLAEMGIDYHFQLATKGAGATTSEISTATAAPKNTTPARMDFSTSAPSPKIRKSVCSQDATMVNVESSDVKKTPVQKSKTSPKLAKNAERCESQVGKVVEAEIEDDATQNPPSKRKDLPRISPKLLRSRKSQGGNILEAAQKTPAKKTKDLPRISPKMLRSGRKSHGANVAETDSYDVERTPANLTKELPRISPKLLRSRKSQGAATLLERGSVNVSKIMKTPATHAEKTKDLPRISPKLLRSRKSDASALTPLPSKAAPSTPSKQRKPARKSVF